MTVNDVTVKVIQDKLVEIEKQYNIKIIHCAESGSRAWGFASPDSDFDVRFIYTRPTEEYLTVHETKDFLEIPISDALDINGWDIKKALGLLHASNPTLFEWSNSPIVYKTTTEWMKVKEIINKYFLKRHSLMHYLHMGLRNNREYLQTAEVKWKKYFYVLRPILACRYILDHNCPPPMLFHLLVDEYLTGDIKDAVEKLLKKKMTAGEAKTGPRMTIINDYIAMSFCELDARCSELPKDIPSDWDELDKLFREIVFPDKGIIYYN